LPYVLIKKADIFMNYIKMILKWIWKITKWGFLVIMLLASISALFNLSLPKESEVTEVLSDNQKAYMLEAFNLQQEQGNDLWPEWGNTKIPIIVYNESYAFLVGYDNPPDGWYKMPIGEYRGMKWEKVSNDTFFGEAYYRQLLPDNNVTPENFTVKVGDKWVATMQTKEYASVKFFNGFREELPPVFSSIFPYRIFWNLIMGQAEQYISGLLHESFHAFQGTLVPQKLAQGEMAASKSDQYPWNKNENVQGWKDETSLLLKAYYSENIDSVKHYTAKFLTARHLRRQNASLDTQDITYEQEREWLEGLAKYTELKILLMANQNISYQPVEEISQFPEFKDYRKINRNFNRQVDEVTRAAGRSGESRFYSGGMLQAIVLDKIAPGWKSSAFDHDVFLEDLLSLAVS
jgi:hypothetical protein